MEKSEAKVSLWSQPDRVYLARLRELSPGADAATRTYQARFTILEADDDVRFGMTATVTLSDPAEGQIARVPLSQLIGRVLSDRAIYRRHGSHAAARAAGAQIVRLPPRQAWQWRPPCGDRAGALVLRNESD